MNQMDKIVPLAKRRGFIYAGSEIYGGLANTWDYGPLGVELLRNIENLWWDHFVKARDDIIGLDTNILMNPKVWQASGHTSSFTDVLIDCRKCKERTRADHLIENYSHQKHQDVKVEGLSEEVLTQIIKEKKIPCPHCDALDWTPARKFNLLFETHIGIVPENQSLVYLRGELAQGMFVNFKNILNSTRIKLPFGIAQIGKAFRNEITKGNFIFRTLQFNLAEFEYFFNPKTNADKLFDDWKQEMMDWVKILNIRSNKIKWRPHTKEERSHYSSRTEDIEYDFPFGYKELYGLSYRTDFDLKNHTQKSGVDLTYYDAVTGESFFPHVIEPTFGIDRTVLVILLESYHEDGERIVLKLPNILAPYKVAVFPLVANKKELCDKALQVYNFVKLQFSAVWDDRGNIGKRYFYQDEIGTPWCLTVDYETLKNDTITVRDRNTTKQERIPVNRVIPFLTDLLKGKK